MTSAKGLTSATPEVLLLGGSGRLGSALRTRLGSRAQAPGRATLDLGPASSLAAAAASLLSHHTPTVVVNALAESDVDACERDPEHARRLNADWPAVLARACAARGVPLVHLSTDYVFDGALDRPYRESDAPAPLSVYGHAKLDGERAVLDAHPRAWVLRVSWLWGSPSRNLAAHLLDPAQAGRAVPLSDDRTGTPNAVQWVAAEIADGLLASPAAPATGIGGRADVAPGVWHVSAAGATTWYRFAQAFVAAAQSAGLFGRHPPPRPEPVAELSRPRPAARPRHSALDAAAWASATGRALPAWNDVLRDWIEARAGRVG